MDQKKDLEIFLKKTKPYTPKYLYKYRSMKSYGVEDIFKKNQIYFSRSTEFDDPFESKPKTVTHKSSLKNERYLKNLAKERLPNADKREINKLVREKIRLLRDKSWIQERYQGFIKNIGIYCLSELNDDLIMWSLYSDSHKGFCLEFDSAVNGTLFWEALKVQYKNEYPTVNILEIENPKEYQKSFLTKFSGWEYQEEWRIIKHNPGPGIYSFPPKLLTGVIFGALIAEEDKYIIKAWIEQFPTRICLYQAKLNENKYQIDILPYDKA